mmetsp:Transcript_27473/g.73990  ORF Transcript_27473/g.73990 Transcript_27473/m.73990 type:complete len:197 (+) Transcript_27473:382-972(+)
MFVQHGANVTAVRSNLTDNRADDGGGAIQVDSGHVHLRNETLLERNVAPHGSSVLLSPAATLEYMLPAPPGRWLYIRQGLTFQLDQAHEDSDFPYACPNGVVGGPSAAEQSGPQCSRPCPAGHLCPARTTQPNPCPRGHYVNDRIDLAGSMLHFAIPSRPCLYIPLLTPTPSQPSLVPARNPGGDSVLCGLLLRLG